jgi:hypothetical protein
MSEFGFGFPVRAWAYDATLGEDDNLLCFDVEKGDRLMVDVGKSLLVNTDDRATWTLYPWHTVAVVEYSRSIRRG